jgi:hypothetical protein
MSPSPGPIPSAGRSRGVGLAVALCGALLVALALRVDRRWTDIHMTRYFCAEYPRQLLRGSILRWAGIAAGALLLLASPRAARWAAGRSPSAIANAALRVVLAAVLGLLASDAVLRWARYRDPAGPPVYHFEPDSEGDDLLVYRPIPSHVTELAAGDRRLRFVIDSNDWRVRSEEDVVDFARPTVIFTGESIASGFGLNYEETYPFQVSQDLGVQPVNVAVQGYGNDGAYLRLYDALPRFQHLVATVTLVNQRMIERNVWPDRPHIVLGEDGSRTIEPVQNVDGWLARSPLLHLASNIVHSDEGLRRARAYILATARETREHGALPLFVYTNFLSACLPDETGAPSLERYLFDGLDVIDVRVDLGADTYDPVIVHPNAQAQRKLAEAITRSLREHGVGGGP